MTFSDVLSSLRPASASYVDRIGTLLGVPARDSGPLLELLVPASIALAAYFLIFSRKRDEASGGMPGQSHASPSASASTRTREPAQAPERKNRPSVAFESATKTTETTEANAQTQEPRGTQERRVTEANVQMQEEMDAEKTRKDDARREAWRKGLPMSLSARRLAAQRGELEGVERRRSSRFVVSDEW